MVDGNAMRPAELIGLINEAEEILAAEVKIIPLFRRMDPGAVWADEVAGYRHNPSHSGGTWNLEEWYRIDLP